MQRPPPLIVPPLVSPPSPPLPSPPPPHVDTTSTTGAAWFRSEFGFDEAEADRDTVRAYCAQRCSGLVGAFHEVGLRSMPIELLSADGAPLYMCTCVNTHNVGFLQRRRPGEPYRFRCMRNTGAVAETASGGGWEQASVQQNEAFHAYARHGALNGCGAAAAPASPFVDAARYTMVVLCLSRGRRARLARATVDDVLVEQYAAVHVRGERAMFQAAGQFNYLATPTTPSDGIRHYVAGPAAAASHQAVRCALATPVATLHRNWLRNGDDTQCNGLAGVVRALELQHVLAMRNGRARLTSDGLVRARAWWAAPATAPPPLPTDATHPGLAALVANELRIGVTTS